jgi:serine phosphatase RsbU (regulator of sigma subunit)/integral membrane sensor domain MASE1
MARPDRPVGGALLARPPWRLVLTVALAYAAGSLISFALFEASSLGAVLFPPAGVTLSALLLTPRARWPWVLGTVVVVEATVDLAYGLPLNSVPGFVLANTVEPLVGASLVRRFGGPLDLRRRRDLGRFVACGVLAGPFVGALIGATTNALAFGRDWWDAFLPFWAGDGLGVLTVAGTVLSWRAGGAPDARAVLRRLLLVALTAAVTVVAFSPDAVPLAYLPVPLLFLFAFRYGVPVVTAAGLAMALTANVMTAAGRGPWSELADEPNLEIAALQVFLAVALLGAWLLAVEIGERESADSTSRAEAAARRQVEALQDVTAGLATAATSDAMAEVIVRRGIGMVADSGAVGVLSPGGDLLRTWSTTGEGGPDRAEIALDAPSLLATAVRTGAAVTAGTATQVDAYPQGLATGPVPGVRSALAVPARWDDVTVGGLAFGFDDEAAVDADALALAGTLAELMVQALRRAQLYEDEWEAAHQLQQAFLPVVPDRLSTVRIGGCYRPADQHHDIGGDWYDAFALPDGRVGFVVGDVVGHDLPAAAAMGRLHTALRVLAGNPHDGPAEVLDALDRACRDIPGTALATIGYGEYDPGNGVLRYACAGHPPPLLVHGGSVSYLPDGRSRPLAASEGPRGEAAVVVPPGAMLVWYSDGLVERRDSDLDAGLDRLAAAAAGIAGADPQAWCDTVLSELTGGRTLDDDVVLMCLQLTPRMD